MIVDIAARIGELGRQPEDGKEVFRQISGPDFVRHRRHPARRRISPAGLQRQAVRDLFRFLETEDEYFDYAPAKIPPQGRWRIYGINCRIRFCARSITRTRQDYCKLRSRCEAIGDLLS